MRLAFVWPLIAALAACGGDAPPGPDAAHFCAGSAYDPCNDEHNCAETTGASCMPLGPNAESVCTLGCTPGQGGCPVDAAGAAGTCNDLGLCVPSTVTSTCVSSP